MNTIVKLVLSAYCLIERIFSFWREIGNKIQYRKWIIQLVSKQSMFIGMLQRSVNPQSNQWTNRQYTWELSETIGCIIMDCIAAIFFCFLLYSTLLIPARAAVEFALWVTCMGQTLLKLSSELTLDAHPATTTIDFAGFWTHDWLRTNHVF